VKASQTPFISKPRDFFGLGSEPRNCGLVRNRL
jgi:hypothetical protein